MTKQELEKLQEEKSLVSVDRNGVKTKGVIRTVCKRLFILDVAPNYLPSVFMIEEVEVTEHDA